MFGPVNPQAFSGIQQQSPEQPMSPDQMNVYLMNKVDASEEIVFKKKLKTAQIADSKYIQWKSKYKLSNLEIQKYGFVCPVYFRYILSSST